MGEHDRERPQNVAFGKGKGPLLSGKSRLVKYYRGADVKGWTVKYCNLARYVLPSVKLTNRSLKMSRNLKRKGSSSNHHFSGAM